MILGWEETVTSGAGVNVLEKLKSRAILHNLYRNEASKDFKLVARNGVEVACHRVIFKGAI